MGKKIMVTIMWAITVSRYKDRATEWKSDDLKIMDRTTRNIMTLYGAWCPKKDVNIYQEVKKREDW